VRVVVERRDRVSRYAIGLDDQPIDAGHGAGSVTGGDTP
jgi:hypothetical protein